MVIIRVTIKKPRWLTQSVFNQVMKASMESVGRQWHVKILPDHFSLEESKKYRYRKRSSDYTKQKQRRFGHTDPLRWKDRLKRVLLRRSGRSISATKGKVTVTLRTAGHANYTRRGKELTAFSKYDQQQLARHLRDDFADRLSKVEGFVNV